MGQGCVADPILEYNFCRWIELPSVTTYSETTPSNNLECKAVEKKIWYKILAIR